MPGWSSPISRPTSSALVTSAAWKFEHPYDGVARAWRDRQRARPACWRCADGSPRSTSRCWRSPGSRSRVAGSPASASWATAGISRRLVRSPEAPKRTMRSIMGCPLSGPSAATDCPVTPGRARKIEPARGCAERPLGVEVEPRRRDVEIAAVGTTEGHRRRVGRRDLDDPVEPAVGAVAVHRPGPPQRHPQHAVVVDGHAVGPDLVIGEVEQPPATGEAARLRVQVEDVDDAERGVGEIEPPRDSSKAGPLEIVRPSTTRVTVVPSTR